MNLSDIKTELFTRTTLTDYGVKFESFNRNKFNELKPPERDKPYFIITVHILNSGGINIESRPYGNHLSIQQLDEIQRISQILRMEK